MPFSINGFGTNYWGKAHRHVRRGVCEFCGKPATLQTYDTTLYFTAVFFPVLPLGRKRVFDDCSACKKHRVTPLRKYRKNVQEALSGIMRESAESKEDSVVEMLGALVGLRATKEFNEVAARLERMDWTAAKPLVALSEAWEFFNDPVKSEALMERAVKLEPSREHLERLHSLQAVNGRFDRLRPVLEEKLAGNPVDFHFLSLYAEALVAHGRADEAARLLEKLNPMRKPSATQEGFDRLLPMIDKPRGREARALRAHYAPQPPLKPGLTFSGHFARWAMPAILLTVGSVVAYKGLFAPRHIPVRLVSGLPHAYTAVVNGVENPLRAGRTLSISVPEGEVTVEMRSPYPGFRSPPPQTLTLERSFGQRLLDDEIFLLNPDRLAVLVRETATYATDEDLDTVPESSFEIRAGELVHEVDDIDYVLGSLPEEIELVNGEPTRKTAISLIPWNGLAGRINLLAANTPRDTLVDWLARNVELYPDDREALDALAGVADPETLERVLTPLLDDRPLRVEAHRTYQSLLEKTDREAELQARYRKGVEDRPEDAAALYLLARINRDDAEAVEQFERAAAMANPSSHAVYALAYRAASTGRSNEALVLAERARALQASQPQFEILWRQMLWANRDWKRLLPELENGQRDAPWDFNANESLVLARADSGDIAGAESALADYQRRLFDDTADLPREEAEELLRQIRASLNSLLPEPAPMIPAPMGTAYSDFMIAALNRDLGFCRAFVERFEGEPGLDVLFVMARLHHLHGDPESAATFSRRFADLIRGVSPEAEQLSEWLSGDQAPSGEEVTALNLHPQLKKYGVALLADRFPNVAADYADLRRRLNYLPAFPAPLVAPDPG